MTLRFGILVFPNVQQLDLTGPYEVFASAQGAEVELVWKDRNPVLSSTRLSLTPTATFDDCPPLDVLCIPGGGGVNPLLEDQAVLDFVRERAAEARYVTSVCSGALVLGAAGLLKGKRATTHWNAHDFLAALRRHPGRRAHRRGRQSDHRRRRHRGHRFRAAAGRQAAWQARGGDRAAVARICSGSAVPFGHACGGLARSAGAGERAPRRIARRARIALCPLGPTGRTRRLETGVCAQKRDPPSIKGRRVVA